MEKTNNQTNTAPRLIYDKLSLHLIQRIRKNAFGTMIYWLLHHWLREKSHRLKTCQECYLCICIRIMISLGNTLEYKQEHNHNESTDGERGAWRSSRKYPERIDWGRTDSTGVWEPLSSKGQRQAFLGACSHSFLGDCFPNAANW